MGWLDKLQDGAQFDGLTNKGFNYNGAWGGPAQDGIERMSSRKLRGVNLMLAEEEKKKKDLQELQSTGKIKHPRSLKHKQVAPRAEVRKHVPQPEVERQLEQMANPMTAMGYLARGQDIPDRFSKGERNPLDYAVDIINPAGIAEGLANIPKDLMEGNYLGAGINTLASLPMAHEFGPQIKQALKPGLDLASDLTKARSVREGVARTFRGIPIESTLPRVGKADLKAMRQVQEIGLMSDLEEKTHRELLQHALDQGIPDEHLQKAFGKTRQQIQEHLAIPEAPNPHLGTTIDLSRPSPAAHRELERQAAERRAETLRRRTGLDEDQMAQMSEMGELTPINSQREQELASEFGGGEDELSSMFNEMPASLRNRLAQSRVQTPPVTQASDIDIEGLLGQMASRPRTTDVGRTSRRELEDAGFIDWDAERLAHEEQVRQASGRTRTVTDAANVQRADDLLSRMRAEAAGELDPHGNVIQNMDEWMSQQQAPPMTLAGKVQDAQQVARGLAERTGQKTTSLIDKYSQAYPTYSGPVQENVPILTAKQAGSRKEIQRKVAEARERLEAMPSGTVASGSLNTSHSSWLPQLKEVFGSPHGDPKFLGHHQMNEMGYLSDAGYSPKEVASYLNTEIDEMIRKKRVPKDVSRPFEKEGKVVLPHYGIQRHQQGGIITDEMGQWKYPGEITRIPSNRITMEGVPYPVLGVSDTGDKKLMKPGKNYKFKGSSVTEYPKGKNGKELTKLDQLTNFTNYNKPTKGGWLDQL